MLVKNIKNFLKKKRKKKQQYGCERYKNLSKDVKQKLVDYRKKHYRMRKMSYYNYKNYYFKKRMT